MSRKGGTREQEGRDTWKDGCERRACAAAGAFAVSWHCDGILPNSLNLASLRALFPPRSRAHKLPTAGLTVVTGVSPPNTTSGVEEVRVMGAPRGGCTTNSNLKYLWGSMAVDSIEQRGVSL